MLAHTGELSVSTSPLHTHELFIILVIMLSALQGRVDGSKRTSKTLHWVLLMLSPGGRLPWPGHQGHLPGAPV